MNPVVDAITENLRHIQVIFEPTLDSFKKDTKQTADVREVSIQDFVKSFFPTTYDVRKGPIYNSSSQSNEIDCVIIAPNHPPLITPKRQVILAEGVYAAIEIKPDISTLTENSEFFRGLGQIKSVKLLERKITLLFTMQHMPDDSHKIPCVLFSKNSQSAENTINFMKRCVADGKFKANELPDMVVILDKEIIFHTTYIKETPLYSWAKKYISDDNNEVYIRLDTGEQTLAMFLFLLYSYLPPEPRIGEDFMCEYIKQGIQQIPYMVYQA